MVDSPWGKKLQMPLWWCLGMLKAFMISFNELTFSKFSLLCHLKVNTGAGFKLGFTRLK